MFLKPSKRHGKAPELKSSKQKKRGQEHMNVWLGNGPFMFEIKTVWFNWNCSFPFEKVYFNEFPFYAWVAL